MTPPVVIVGAGGAGLIAAWKAALSGVPVLLLDRNSRAGVKILISGGGKCNVTHAGSIENLLSAFSEQERRFLKPSFYKFSNEDFLKVLAGEGVDTMTRANGRVFPVSESAKDVMAAFSTLLGRANVTIRLNSRVEEVLAEKNSITGIRVGGHTLLTDHLILATGGVSYPRTGTTGDGYRWAAALGHTIVPLRAALAPIRVAPALPRDWQGVAIRDCRLVASAGRRRIGSRDGDLLFTHEGVSGPAALELSKSVAAAAESEDVELYVDVLPDRSIEAVDLDLNATVQSHRSRSIGTILEAWMPNRLVEPLLERAGVDRHTRGHVLSREDRRMVAGTLKKWHIGKVAAIPIERGEVTAGGVSLREVNPKTMQSRIVRGLYLCGEILDIAGPIGGYNLQAAFSTGFVAGESAAAEWKRANTSAG